VKVSSTERQKDKKGKKPPQTVPPIEDKPTTNTKRESRSAEKFSEIKSSKKKKKKEKEKEVAKVSTPIFFSFVHCGNEGR
jgi:hypothetical protein